MPMLLLTKPHLGEGWTFTKQLCRLSSALYSSGAITILLALVIILHKGKAAKQGSLNKYSRKEKKKKKKSKSTALLASLRPWLSFIVCL